MRKNRIIFKVGGIGIMAAMLALSVISCKKNKTQDTKKEELLMPITEVAWEENQSTEGCKLYADYPSDSTSALARNIREWINESLGGIYSGSLNDGKQMIEFYGKKRAEKVKKDIAEYGENTAMEKSMYYVQLRNKFETKQFITYTSEIYEYSGGAHGSESQTGAVFRKEDGRKFGWDMFTIEGQIKLRDLIKNEIKTKYFKAKSDEEFYAMLLAPDARYIFPLPVTAPICLRSGVRFVYQQYEIAPYAAGMPSCTIPYEVLENYFTTTARPMMESHTDSVATIVSVAKYLK